MPRVIKKYENRKLYDLEAKRYVRLSDLAGLIRSGAEVVVIDNHTGQDVTAQTLAKLIGESAGQGEPLLPGQLLHEVVRGGGRLMASGVNQAVRGSLELMGLPRGIRREMAHLRRRLEKLEAIVNELSKEESNGGDNSGHLRDTRNASD